MDHLATLLKQFNLHAATYFQGGFCGSSHYADPACGHIHLLRGGGITFQEHGGRLHRLEEPGLMLVVRPNAHRLIASETDRAELVCATLRFDGGAANPLRQALPDYIVSPLRELPQLTGCIDWLFDEVVGQGIARELVLNRLFELAVIQALRQLLAERRVAPGVLAGLADNRLCRALAAMHERPREPWTVAELAGLAAMSRASFAEHFRRVVGDTPADYLATWRVTLAQGRLRAGAPIAVVAQEVGYESASALARAFRRKIGLSPRQWLRLE
ncbi:AraC family transcriptional regulator [Pseudomonas sp. zfem002]|uniref:AraC family transcriptional regulator n=1 Tax=Pseudomonas sp. zfem002 TaxID=3078197 RepID=UPI002929EA03|nr:AraC family transcriptional regulator [Pseudomonas sp. zfem002]MDU9393348.1 AraC family transcriptional regulator [Pseudomonas sp. zfem002]